MSISVENYRRESEEVYFIDQDVPLWTSDTVSFVKSKALSLPSGKCRVCAHAGPEARHHAMLIAHREGVYVRPHRHLSRSETLHVVDGCATAVLFDDHGNVRDTVALGHRTGNGAFFYLLPAGIFHTLIIQSQVLLFIETTTGPFDRTTSEFAPWAPDGSDERAAAAYVRRLFQAHPQLTESCNQGF